MKWPTGTKCVIGSAVLGICAISLLVGCEGATGVNLAVSPAATDVTGVDTVTLSVTATNHVFPPLQWSVSNPALGLIVSSEGYSAVYESTGALGNNVIEVRDQGDGEGVATVSTVTETDDEEEGVL